jgi:hypothetical protein
MHVITITAQLLDPTILLYLLLLSIVLYYTDYTCRSNVILLLLSKLLAALPTCRLPRLPRLPGPGPFPFFFLLPALSSFLFPLSSSLSSLTNSPPLPAPCSLLPAPDKGGLRELMGPWGDDTTTPRQPEPALPAWDHWTTGSGR